MFGRSGMAWSPLQIEEHHERLSIHSRESRSSAGSYAGASLAGWIVHTVRNIDWRAAGHCDRPPQAVEQAGAGGRQHYSNHSQSCLVWILAASAMARGTRRSVGDCGADPLRAAADYSEYLYRNPWSRSRCRRGSARDGAHGIAALTSGGATAVSECDPVGSAGGGCDFGWAGHDRGCDWRWRAGRIHLSWSGHG